MPDVLRRTPVVLLEAANLASGTGNAVVMLTIPWLVLEVTGSPALAGFSGALSAFPGLVSAPLAGWLVDRYGRRIVSVVSDVLSAVSVAAIPLVASVGELSFPLIVVIAVLGATFDPAGYTARRSLLPDAARSAGMDLDRLNGVHEGIAAAGWTVGPLLGSALIASVGSTLSFWAPCALFLLAGVAVAGVRTSDAGQQARAQAGAEPAGGWQDLVRGFTALWLDRPLRLVAIGVVVVAALYLPVQAVLLPTWFEAVGDPAALGIVVSALAGGSLVGAFGYGWLARRRSRSAIARLVVLGVAVGMLVLALLAPLPVMATAAFLLGLSWGPAEPLMSTLVQQRIPPDEQGRVYGVLSAAYYVAPPVVIFAVGAAVELWGVPAILLGLAVLLAVFALGAALTPTLKTLDQTPQHEMPPADHS